MQRAGISAKQHLKMEDGISFGPTLLPPHMIVESLVSNQAVPTPVIKGFLKFLPNISGSFLEVSLACRIIQRAVDSRCISTCCVPAIEALAEFAAFCKFEVSVSFPLLLIRVRTEAVLHWAKRAIGNEMETQTSGITKPTEKETMKEWGNYFESLVNMFPSSFCEADAIAKGTRDKLWMVLESNGDESQLATKLILDNPVEKLLEDLTHVVALTQKSIRDPVLNTIARIMANGKFDSRTLLNEAMFWKDSSKITEEVKQVSDAPVEEAMADETVQDASRQRGNLDLENNVNSDDPNREMESSPAQKANRVPAVKIRKRKRPKGKKPTEIFDSQEEEEMGAEIVTDSVPEIEPELPTEPADEEREASGAVEDVEGQRSPAVVSQNLPESLEEEIVCNICGLFVQKEDGSAYLCNGCQNWQHLECSGIEDEVEMGSEWFCLSCERNKLLEEVKKAMREEIRVIAELKSRRRAARMQLKEIHGELSRVERKLASPAKNMRGSASMSAGMQSMRVSRHSSLLSEAEKTALPASQERNGNLEEREISGAVELQERELPEQQRNSSEADRAQIESSSSVKVLPESSGMEESLSQDFDSIIRSLTEVCSDADLGGSNSQEAGRQGLKLLREAIAAVLPSAVGGKSHGSSLERRKTSRADFTVFEFQGAQKGAEETSVQNSEEFLLNKLKASKMPK